MGKYFPYIGLVVIVFLAKPVPAQEELPNMLVMWDIVFQPINTGTVFDSIPEEIRAIPEHPGDNYFSSEPPPLPAGGAEYSHLRFGVRTMFGTRFRKWFAFLGPSVSFEIPQSGSRVERNQFGGERRGEGMSLRYYEVSALRPPRLQVNILLLSPLINNGRFRLGAGGELDPFSQVIEIESGWDRYDRDEVWKTFRVGKLREQRGFIRLEYYVDRLKMYGSGVICYLEIGSIWSSFNPAEEFSEIRYEKKGLHLALGAVIRFYS